MPRPRIAMRKIRDVLRLSRAEGLSPRQIASPLSLPRITVRRYLERAALAQLPWPLPAEMNDEELEANSVLVAGPENVRLIRFGWCRRSGISVVAPRLRTESYRSSPMLL